ncbi:hypothetical protein B0H14DRAFT_3133357 [Mycena olivaceomarginata]|nr:hypothetical protein B0H14DRAFT_3133357 [Mycena olivaceomarginata]
MSPNRLTVIIITVFNVQALADSTFNFNYSYTNFNEFKIVTVSGAHTPSHNTSDTSLTLIVFLQANGRVIVAGGGSSSRRNEVIPVQLAVEGGSKVLVKLKASSGGDIISNRSITVCSQKWRREKRNAVLSVRRFGGYKGHWQTARSIPEARAIEYVLPQVHVYEESHGGDHNILEFALVLKGEERSVSIAMLRTKMLLGFVLPLVFLMRPAYAQGDDTIANITVPALIDIASITPLNNITMELMLGSFEDNGNEVVDIMAVEWTSTSSHSVDYNVHASTPAGNYHIRMNGTIYNGNTPLSNVTTRSPTMNITIGNNFQCNTPAAFIPVRSLSDADYSPVRVIKPVAGDVVFQTQLAGPYGSIGGFLATVDDLFDVAGVVNPTLELVNMETGFNTSPQSLENQTLFKAGFVQYATDNVTLKPGTWKMRMNFTVTDPGSTRKFSALSDEFFVAQQSPCVGLAQSSSSSSVAAQSTLATGTSPPTLPTSSAAASKTPSSTSPSGFSNPSNARRVMRVSKRLLLGALLQATIIGFFL